jgi:TnpA family transposase
MPRRSILSATERESLLTLPDAKDELIRHYTFNETDLSVIRQRRGAANRLGFAVQLCYLRFPGIFLGVDDPPFLPLLRMVAAQLKVPVGSWNHYGQREQTRREHLVELQTVFGFKPFTMSHYRQAVHTLTELALQTDKGIVLASTLVENLRRQSIILPAMNAIERASAEAITRANRSIHAALADSLIPVHRQCLDELLKRKDGSKMTWLAWLRQSPAKPNSRHMLEHIERLKAWQALDLPAGIERQVHQNRLLKIAREGGQMTPADLAKFESQRRYATLVALAIEGMATVTDEIIDLHDRIIGKLFNAAKNKHQQQFQASGKAINDKVRMYGRIERTLFILDWLQSVELRRRVHAGLNKGEALDDTLLQYLSPLGWEHINLTGDYLWRSSARSVRGSSGHCDRCHRLSVLYLMRWSLPPSRYYAEDRLSFGELSWKTLRSLVSIWVKTLSIFIARIVAGRLFTVKNLPGQS